MTNQLMHPDDYADELGDGYTNDFQRAAAASRNEPARDDATRIAMLLAQGYFVAVEYRTRYCRTTDAVIGETAHIISFDMRRSAVVWDVQTRTDDGDSDARIVILPREVAVAPAPTVVDTDEIPF